MGTTLSPFLLLPRELRYKIYYYLCRYEPKSYPFPTPPISSIDQKPPPLNLFLTCRYLYEEIRTYFYGRATLRFIAQDVLRIRRINIQPAALSAIQQAKKIELRLQWNITEARGKANISTWPRSMNGWFAEQIDLLLDEGKNLELLIVSVIDASGDMDWRSKKRMLVPLKKVVGKVNIRVGEVVALDGEEEVLRERLGEYVRELNTAKMEVTR